MAPKMYPTWLQKGSPEASRKEVPNGGPYFAPNPLASRREAIFSNLAIMEREAREERELQALQARQEQREQQELPEQRRQHHEEQQRKSG